MGLRVRLADGEQARGRLGAPTGRTGPAGLHHRLLTACGKSASGGPTQAPPGRASTRRHGTSIRRGSGRSERWQGRSGGRNDATTSTRDAEKRVRAALCRLLSRFHSLAHQQPEAGRLESFRNVLPAAHTPPIVVRKRLHQLQPSARRASDAGITARCRSAFPIQRRRDAGNIGLAERHIVASL